MKPSAPTPANRLQDDLRSASKVVTIKDIASAARLSLATVSYALRNSPKIPESTRSRVHTVAHSLGYRPNPRVASLMSHIRAHRGSLHEQIAFVWVHTSRLRSSSDPFLRRIFEGARQRAEQAGFSLAEFWTDDSGLSDRRLEQIIKARGITGVVFSPLMSGDEAVKINWDWSAFSTAIIGNALWQTELHRAGHYHYYGMRMTLMELAKMGCRHPVALIERDINERSKRCWESAFLTHHPCPGRARANLRLVGARDSIDVESWIEKRSADALIVSSIDLYNRLQLQRSPCIQTIPAATLHWNPAAGRLGGVDQCHAHSAAQAIDLVLTQLNRNERGVPEMPRMVLFQGRWVRPTMHADNDLRNDSRVLHFPNMEPVACAS